jgi:branched-chain amino acid transport system substrate-binding protein
MNRKNIGVCLFLIVLIATFGFFYNNHKSNDYFLRKRAELAADNHGNIDVAVVWSTLTNKSFLDGVNLAVKEVNQKGIKLTNNNNAHIILHEYDDSTLEDAEDTWLSISKNPEIVAVIGHSSSASAIPASISYEYNGVLFISAVATDPALTFHDYKYTFSVIPSDQDYADKLVEYARKRKFFKLIILYIGDEFGNGFYEEFTSRLNDDFEIVASRSFYQEEQDIIAGNLNSNMDMIFQIMHYDFDAIVLIARNDLGIKMINLLNLMGVNKPVLGSEGLDNQEMKKVVSSTEGIFIASVFPGSDSTNPQQISFIDNFKKTYGYAPDFLAAQGYDAIKVLAGAYELAKTTIPIEVGVTLRYYYPSKYNDYRFDVNGKVINKKIYIKTFKPSKAIDLDSSQ